MKRLRLFFAAILLFLALPTWRLADYLVVFSPFESTFRIALIFIFALFFLVPMKLIFNKIKAIVLIIFILGFGLLSWFVSPLSNMSTMEPVLNHCGNLTWTGMFYSFRSFLSEAYMDDLEARNQMCWLRKMIKRVPGKFESAGELEQFEKIVREKLLKPDIKFRISLPLIIALNMNVLASYEGEELPMMMKGKFFFENIQFWENQYTILISDRLYGPISAPHSYWIKFEYGLLEKNLDKILAGLNSEN